MADTQGATPHLRPAIINEDDPAPGERSRLFVAMLGIACLLAWFILLWFMFGDVL